MSPQAELQNRQAKKYILFSEEGASGNLLLEQYIAGLDRALTGSIPDSYRRDLLEETQTHLEQAVRAGVERGQSLLDSTQSAIDRYGSAASNARDYIESWFQGEPRSPMTKRFGRANLISYGIFQMIEVIYFLVLQLNVFMPNESIYRIPFSPAEVRSVWPSPLPFPDMSVEFLILVGYPLLAPLVGGWLVGRLVPVRAAAAVYRGLVPLILISFVMGALLLPMTEGLLFALFQLAFWLPVGCFTAYLSSFLARRSRCRAHDASANSLKHSHFTEK